MSREKRELFSEINQTIDKLQSAPDLTPTRNGRSMNREITLTIFLRTRLGRSRQIAL